MHIHNVTRQSESADPDLLWRTFDYITLSFIVSSELIHHIIAVVSS